MAILKPASSEGLERLVPFIWRSTSDDGAFVIDVPAGAMPFVCFFLSGRHTAPRLALDRGEGFDDLGAISFRPFPLGFYHVSLATLGSVQRLRFRPSDRPSTFRCVVFQTGHPLLVAVLHYLFNLRYLKVGVLAPRPRGFAGWVTGVRGNVARIRKFFSDVSAGRGVRVQQAPENVIEHVRVAQSVQAQPIQASMREHLSGREQPLLSFVVPIYNTEPRYLDALVASFAKEEAPYAELILTDDGSTSSATKAAVNRLSQTPNVLVQTLPQNAGIAATTNVGIGVARGTWVAFIDHDDAFAAGSIAVIAKAILDYPQAEFFYTDEIITDLALKPMGTFCKPAFDRVLLSGMNYINHFSVFRRARLTALGGLRLDCEGSQDYDLLLRYLAEAPPGAIVHIPYLAYLWRRGEASYSAVFQTRSVENARGALRRAYAGRDQVEVEAAARSDVHRIRFKGAPRPRVSVVIPNRDSWP